jgi:hypothetical protein
MKMASRLTSDAGTTPNHFGAQIASYVASPSYAAGSDPRASVVVSTYGRAQFLLELIEALSHQEMPLVDYEVVVVDNGSDDTTWDFLEKLVPAAPISILALRSLLLEWPVAREVGVGVSGLAVEEWRSDRRSRCRDATDLRRGDWISRWSRPPGG